MKTEKDKYPKEVKALDERIYLVDKFMQWLSDSFDDCYDFSDEDKKAIRGLVWGLLEKFQNDQKIVLDTLKKSFDAFRESQVKEKKQAE